MERGEGRFAGRFREVHRKQRKGDTRGRMTRKKQRDRADNSQSMDAHLDLGHFQGGL